MRIEAENVHAAWTTLLNAVMHFGKKVTITGSVNAAETKEIIGTSVHVRDLRSNIITNPLRDINYRFMLAEWLWIAAGRNDVESIARYNRHIANWSDDGLTFSGAYGPRLMVQWNYVLDTLRRDPSSRQAVASIWTPNPQKSKDIPCTLTAQFFIRDRSLHSVWSMRSNDLWLGFPHDFFNFSQLTNGLAGELGVGTGSLTLNAGSSHIYARNYEQVEKLLIASYRNNFKRSQLLKRYPNAAGIMAVAEYHCADDFMLNPQELSYSLALGAATKAQALTLLDSVCEF